MTRSIELFSDCGDSKVRQMAGDVLAGSHEIAAVIEKRCMAIPASVDWSDFLEPAFSGLWLDYKQVGEDSWDYIASDDEEYAPGPGLYELTKIRELLQANETYRLFPGVYPLVYSREIAGKLISQSWNPVEDVFDSMAYNFSPLFALSNGIATFQGARLVEIIHQGVNCNVIDFLTRLMHENKHLASIRPMQKVALGFISPMNNSVMDDEKPITQTRNRQSDLDYLILQYFKDNPVGGYPGFARFLKKEGARMVPGDKWEWVDATGEIQKPSVSTIKNRLSALRQTDN